MDGLRDLHILELADVPVQKAQLRVGACHILARIFHEHLLLQHGPGEDGMDEIAVEARMVPADIPVEFLLDIPQQCGQNVCILLFVRDTCS